MPNTSGKTLELNRIYQGRVQQSAFLGKKEHVESELSRQETVRVLTDFHNLFQDAVNYYIVCLLSLASSEENALTETRKLLDGENPEYNVWRSFCRKGVMRAGLRNVVRYFGLDPDSATFEDCRRKILEGNTAAPETLDLALQELVFFCQSTIQQSSKTFFPQFCRRGYEGTFKIGASAETRTRGAEQLHTRLHRLETPEAVEGFASELQLDWVVNLASGKFFKDEESRKRLLKAVAHFRQIDGKTVSDTTMGKSMRLFLEQGDWLPLLDSIAERIRAMPLDKLPEIPANRKSIPDRLEAAILFKHFPSDSTARLLRASYPEKDVQKVAAKKGSSSEAAFGRYGKDAIELARAGNGRVFRAFTALSCFRNDGSGEPHWAEFDMLAFQEALKTFNQIALKTDERRKEKERLKQLLRHMETGIASGSDDEEADVLPVLGGDERIAVIDRIRKELSDEHPTDLSEDGKGSYSITERTIRCFGDLCRAWQKLERGGNSASDEDLKQALNVVQTENRDDIGSVELFAKLIKPENRIVWRNAFERLSPDSAKAGHAADPLAAYVRREELIEEIAALDAPVRLTPADANHSPRQYQFTHPRHIPNALSFTTLCAHYEEGKWTARKHIRIDYSAPRFYRDGLRGTEEDLSAMNWLQPMMAALGDTLEAPQNMIDFAVFLMPSRTRDGVVNLNFPVTLDVSGVIRSLANAGRWEKAFVWMKDGDKNLYLRWPSENADAAWHKDGKPFRLLSVDLGQRTAGAYAVLECRPAEKSVPSGTAVRHARHIGEAESRTWQASAAETGMLRLPGENAGTLRNGQRVEELYGEKGRTASAAEGEQTLALIREMGFGTFAADLSLNPAFRFFAFQNEKLLTALRWMQGRLARWQGWSWKLDDPAMRDAVREAILADDTLPADLSESAKAGRWEDFLRNLRAESAKLKTLAAADLEIIANRVLPLKGRSWIWTPREDAKGFILRQTTLGSGSQSTLIAGQRGLSMKRIEMVADLRRRCQSLNQALSHEFGCKAELGWRTKGRTVPDPCPDILAKLERIREERVNQTAHLILAAALGVRLREHRISVPERRNRDLHGEYEKYRDPVDFIVLEDLSRYLTSQGRAPKENGRLMKWCHRAVRDKIKELAQTYGLKVLEVNASYSSRFSAKDGTPGFRAREITEKDFRNLFLNRAKKDAPDENLAKLEALFREAGAPGFKLLIPVAGGPLFVPMSGGVVQADINAAVNIGLRAVAAPDVLEIHNKVRTGTDKAGVPLPKRNSVREKLRWGKTSGGFLFAPGYVHERNGNCFRVPESFRPDFGECSLDGRRFVSGKGLWSTVKNGQWKRIHAINAARLAAYREKADVL